MSRNSFIFLIKWQFSVNEFNLDDANRYLCVCVCMSCEFVAPAVYTRQTKVLTLKINALISWMLQFKRIDAAVKGLRQCWWVDLTVRKMTRAIKKGIKNEVVNEQNRPVIISHEPLFVLYLHCSLWISFGILASNTVYLLHKQHLCILFAIVFALFCRVHSNTSVDGSCETFTWIDIFSTWILLFIDSYLTTMQTVCFNPWDILRCFLHTAYI